MLFQFLLNGLISGFLYALLAMAFGLAYHATKIFHIAYAGLVVVSSYLYYTFAVLLGWPWLVSLLLTIGLAGLINVLTERTMYAPLERRRASPNSLLIASIGLFIILTNLIALFFGNEIKTLSPEWRPAFHFGQYIVTYMQAVQAAVSIATITALMILFNYSGLGLRLKALSYDATLFAVFGNHPGHLRMLLFFLSGGLGALVSILISADVGFDPYFGMSLLLNALVVIIFGGLGSFKGSLAGGLILGLLQSLSVYFFEARWETTITFLLLVLLLLFRPQGLFGVKQRLI